MSRSTMKLPLIHTVLYALSNNKRFAIVEYVLVSALVAIVVAASLTRL